MTKRLLPSVLNKSKILPIGAVVTMLSACSAPEATIQLGGSLSVFPIGTSLELDNLPDDWFTRGNISDDRVGGSAKLGSSTVSITSATAPYLIARRVNANMLATPYLSWRWRFDPGKWSYHPVRLVVGFWGGGTEPAQQGIISHLFPSSSIPVYDRVMSFLWAPSALMRGNLVRVNSEQSSVREAHYMVRGGAENIAKWWTETVDLASIYKQSWPKDQINGVRVAFIGISSTSSKHKLRAYLSDLRLSR